MKQLRINQRTNNLVGTNMKKLRLKRNLRNADIVAKLQLEGVEITSSTYSKVESGTNNPSVDLLVALTDILQCDFNAFFAQ
ncbi:MAG: helix-turn-helix domain-containing protein [Acetatifactor sp.]|nr:helix-turn-helix domain-containing protein [Acetatifactor sp.]